MSDIMQLNWSPALLGSTNGSGRTLAPIHADECIISSYCTMQ